MRWGDLVGLGDPYVRPAEVRVEWQLHELDRGSAATLTDPQSFIAGLHRDHDAVLNGFALPDSSAPSKATPTGSGRSNDNYGRANVDLLRKRA